MSPPFAKCFRDDRHLYYNIPFLLCQILTKNPPTNIGGYFCILSLDKQRQISGGVDAKLLEASEDFFQSLWVVA